jgi:hypothetical protein
MNKAVALGEKSLSSFLLEAFGVSIVVAVAEERWGSSLLESISVKKVVAVAGARLGSSLLESRSIATIESDSIAAGVLNSVVTVVLYCNPLGTRI